MPEDIVPEELHRLDAIELVQLGRSSVTVGGLLTAFLIVFAAIVAARLIGGGLRRLRNRSGEAAPQVYIVEKLATYGLVFFGALAAFSTLGLDLTSLTFFAGALGVGLGFGLQGVFREFISGIVLIFDRLIRIGDYIELQTAERGVVVEIGPRGTRIRNNDDVNIIIPNSRLIEQTVINWTHNNGVRRFHVPFVVAYGSDKEAVREAGAGGTLHFQVLRRGRLVKVAITLDARPDDARQMQSMEDLDRSRRDKAEAYWREAFAPLLRESVG